MVSASYGNSAWSDSKRLLTKPSPSKYRNNNVRLWVRGTGGNNHNTSFIKINDVELMNRGNFVGLYLLVLNRYASR